MEARYVTTWERGIEFVEHLDGVPWVDVPPPPADHEHWPQTRGFMHGERIERCPCGAFGPEPWFYLDAPRTAEPLRVPLSKRLCAWLRASRHGGRSALRANDAVATTESGQRVE